MTIETIKCRECGSADVTEFKAGSYVCGHCEAIFKHMDPTKVTVNQAPQVCECGHPAEGQCVDCGKWVCKRHQGISAWPMWCGHPSAYAIDPVMSTGEPRPDVLPADLPLSLELLIQHEVYANERSNYDRVFCKDCNMETAVRCAQAVLEQHVPNALPPWPSHWWNQANAGFHAHSDRTSAELAAFRDQLLTCLHNLDPCDVAKEWETRGGTAVPTQTIALRKPNADSMVRHVGRGHPFRGFCKAKGMLSANVWVKEGALWGVFSGPSRVVLTYGMPYRAKGEALVPLRSDQVDLVGLIRAMRDALVTKSLP